jgi:electron transport complex protein RnfG
MNMNKTKIVSMMSGAVLLLLAATLQSAAPQKDNVMTKEDGMYVVNTTTLGKNVTGYVSSTPVKIYIKKDKIVKVEALKNEETPKYMARVKKNLLNKWDGMKVKDAQKMEVDGVTGATFTSDAIKENIKLGLDYYKKHK